MNGARVSIVCAVVGFACFGAGFWVSRKAPDSPPRVVSPAVPARPEVHRPNVETEPAGHTSTVAQLQTAIQSARSGPSFQRLYEVAATLDPDKIKEAVAAIEKMPNAQARFVALSQLLARWAQRDPVAAMQYAESLQNKSQRQQAMAQVFGSWLEADEATAETWAKQLPAGQLKTQAFSQLAGKLAQDNPQAALADRKSVV